MSAILTYTGPADVHRLGPADGLEESRTFVRGVPLEVSDDEALLILEGPLAGRFTVAEAEDPTTSAPALAGEDAAAGDGEPASPDAPPRGDSTEEG